MESSKGKIRSTLYAYEREESLFLDLVYNADLFEASTVERMLSRFEVLLEAIVAQPDRRIGALPMLTGHDRKTYTLSDNPVRPKNSYLEFPRTAIEQSIATRFEEQAKKYASQTAIKTFAHQWTYAQLDRRRTRSRGRSFAFRGKRSANALLVDHDAPMVAAILGCLKAGKTYVPLSPSHPRERLESIILDSQPRLLVTDAANEKLARELSAGELHVIDVGPCLMIRRRSSVKRSSPDSLAYLLYTSGSTGEAKGVAQNHRNVLHHIRNYTNSLHILRVIDCCCWPLMASMPRSWISSELLNGATLLPFDIRKHDFVSLGRWIRQSGSRSITPPHGLSAFPANGS